MGQKELANIDLLFLCTSGDERRTVYRDKPIMFSSYGSVCVSWCQQLRLTGDYLMEVELKRNDVMRLFKAIFGSKLTTELMKEYGLTLSPEATKSVLRTVKLSDLTLGDPASMNGTTSSAEPAAADKLVEHANVTPFSKAVVALKAPSTAATLPPRP